MSLKSGLIVIGAVGLFTLIGTNSGVWNLSSAVIENDFNVKLADKKNGLIATEFYEKKDQSDSNNEGKTRYWFKVTNNLNQEVNIIVTFDKIFGPGQEDDQDDNNDKEEQKGKGIGLVWAFINPMPASIPPKSFVEFPVLVTNGHPINPSLLGVKATVIARWPNGGAIIKDELPKHE